MAKDVIMPKFGFTQENAQIVRWLKQAGEAVEQGDPIAEVTTDKVNMEVEAPASGVLDGLRYAEGDTVPVTEVIAVIRRADEVLTGDRGPKTGDSPPPPASRPASAPATPVAQKMAQDRGVDVTQIPGTGPGGRVTKRDVAAYTSAVAQPAGKPAAAPAARRLAGELGVALSAVAGSGPGGRIQSADVRAAAEKQTEDRGPGIEKARPGAGAGYTVIALAGMRRTIAQRLQRSFQEAPHIFFQADIDVTALEAVRQQANARLAKDAPKISVTAILAKACAWALGRHPLLNSHLAGEEIRVFNAVHLGVAVALEADALGGGGLIVPVVRDVGAKGLAQLAAEIADLAARARANRLRPDDVAEGTFTLSNLGMYGVDRFTAILNPPQAGILAVGRARPQFVPDAEGRPVARPVMTVTLSADHRVVDGAVAAQFLADLRAGLEQPSLLLV